MQSSKKENRIVIINSIGPMASTCVAGVLEKLGYLNLPIRKYGLHDYLLGKKISDNYMNNKFIKIIKSHSDTRALGGVSVKDRDNSKPKKNLNPDKVASQIDKIKVKNMRTFIKCIIS